MTQSPRMRVRTVTPAGTLIPATLLGLALLSAGCGETVTVEPVTVETVTVETAAVETAMPLSAEPIEIPAARLAVAELEAVPLVTRATGTVEPWRRASPGTKILGRVERVAVVEGQRVAAGELLADLESRDLEAAVHQAEAAVTMAEAQLENARAQRDRLHDLHSRGSVTDKSLEDGVAAFRVAEAGVEQARAELAVRRVTASYARIESPFAGWVVAKRVEAGDMARPGEALFTLEDLSRVKIHVQVPEADVMGLEPGAAAQVEVLDRELAATVDRVVPAGDPASRTFSVRLLLDNPGGELKSGLYARARFVRGEQAALRVPSTSLVTRGQLEGLFLAGDDARLRLRWIKTGRHEGGRAEVLSGLEAGERYLLDPPPGIADGTPYRLSPRGEP